ncbi:MAG: deoxyribose-phosphate aldolase [Planctomycetota bacterium]
MLPPIESLARTIDHTLLKPDATEGEIAQLCEEAATHRFASVCVNPTYVDFCAKALQGTSVAVCTVIGFPLGANASEVKAYEAYRAQEQGANELDMVLAVGRLKSGNDDYVRNDIRAVVDARRPGSLVKVILETSLLTDDEKLRACKLAQEAGADFVKTSTGFSTGGATEEDILLMRRAVGPVMGVKASGGIRDRETAERMIAAGATRLGASAGIRIVHGEKSDSDY